MKIRRWIASGTGGRRFKSHARAPGVAAARRGPQWVGVGAFGETNLGKRCGRR